MSQLETILTRMMNDPAFAESVFANAEKALAEYSLPVEELAKFKAMSRTEFSNMIKPEERKSLGGIGDPTDLPPGSKNHNEIMN